MYKDKIRIQLQQKVEVRVPDFEYELYDAVQNFPEDYAEFLEHFGEGILGEYLRVFSYIQADELTARWRHISEEGFAGVKYISKYYFDDNQDFIKEAILLGDTIEGDQIIYWNNEYYIYCFQATTFFEKVGSKLEDVFAFYEKGDPWEAIDMSVFTPIDSFLATRSREYLW